MSAWSEYKKKLGETRPWDLLDPNTPRATETDADKRLSICEECPDFIKLTKQKPQIKQESLRGGPNSMKTFFPLQT